MDQEALERSIEFIINQQAQFTVDIQLLREAQETESKARQEQYGKLSDAVVGLAAVMGQLAETQKEMKTDLKVLQAQMRDTDERLNIFINVVERYLSRHENNGAPSAEPPPEQ